MKKLLLALAIVSVVGTVSSFSAARWLAWRQRQMTPANIHDVGWLTRELQLSGPQRREVEKCESEFRGRLNALCTTHCAARYALGEELARPKPDVEKARANVERMNALQADAERLTFEHIMKVRAVLTDEQAQQYGALIHHQVCSVLPGGAM